MPWIKEVGTLILIAIVVRSLWQLPAQQAQAQAQAPQKQPTPEGFSVLPWAAG